MKDRENKNDRCEATLLAVANPCDRVPMQDKKICAICAEAVVKNMETAKNLWGF